MESKRMRVYLSGGMEYARNEGMDWRNKLEEWIQKNLHHSVFNPNKESEKIISNTLLQKDFRGLKSTNIDTYTSIARRFVDQDSKEIALQSDYVVCYWDKSAQQGAGTKGELTIARYFKKPVYMVTRIPKEKIPGWILGCITEYFNSFDQLKEFLLSKY
jgi:hypothetical protein